MNSTLSGVEAVLSVIGKYTWRTFFGVFVAAIALLLFARRLGIEAWVQTYRGYTFAALFLSGGVLLTYVWTTVQARLRERHDRQIDLRIVSGNPMHATWSVGKAPLENKPMFLLICSMNFAHTENGTVIIRRAYIKGAKEVLPISEIEVQGTCDEPTIICIGVSPVKAKPGRQFVSRLVFVDQLNGKHVSEKVTFRPNTVSSDFRANSLKASPNCAFCDKTVEFDEQAPEAQMTAHTTCIWS